MKKQVPFTQNLSIYLDAASRKLLARLCEHFHLWDGRGSGKSAVIRMALRALAKHEGIEEEVGNSQ